MSWDETAVFVAVEGWRNDYDLQLGDCLVNADGSNEWIDRGSMKAHLVEKKSPQEMAIIINEWIMHQPVRPDE
jgi:Ran GTPase-activating protein (RanGAP) involved in mRNA processing and transport